MTTSTQDPTMILEEVVAEMANPNGSELVEVVPQQDAATETDKECSDEGYLPSSDPEKVEPRSNEHSDSSEPRTNEKEVSPLTSETRVEPKNTHALVVQNPVL